MKIIVIAPTYRETQEMLNSFTDKMDQVALLLKEKGHTCEYYFLSDGQTIDLKDKTLLVHEMSQGLAYTLVEGYEEVLKQKPDIVVRIDTNENDPFNIIEIVNRFEMKGVDTVFCPMTHLEVNETALESVQKEFELFKDALCTWNGSEIERLYNNVFPLGFQSFNATFLTKLIPFLKKGLSVFEELFSQRPSWGLDLLVVLLSCKLGKTDFYFEPVETPAWKHNKSEEKSREQADRARKMIEVAHKLG